MFLCWKSKRNEQIRSVVRNDEWLLREFEVFEARMTLVEQYLEMLEQEIKRGEKHENLPD